MLTSLVVSHLLVKPLLLAHYMPWYSAPPKAETYGWHWTMDKYDPAIGEIASHYKPRIGVYDSSDADVIEYHLLTMKVSGIDGVIIDWYGTSDFFDYLTIHKNTEQVIKIAESFGMKYAICFEDQTIKKRIENKKLDSNWGENDFAKTVSVLKTGWFSSPHYVHVNGKPIFLIFGPQHLDPAFVNREANDSFFTYGVLGNYEHLDGGFAWPEPQVGHKESFNHLGKFYSRAKEWKSFISVAYPRFHDIYEQANIHPSYGKIHDDSGKTLQLTLQLALESKSPIIQIATWNDWGEGTQIEPSEEFGTRDLQYIQEFKRAHFDPKLPVKFFHISMPYRLFALRKTTASPEQLNAISQLILNGNYGRADSELNKLEGNN